MVETRARTLRASSLSVRYGGVVANRDLDVVVEPGEVVGLIGPNGAGKTTFVDAVSGFTACEGRVLLGEHELAAVPPHTRRRLGLSRTWQSGELFGSLTVLQNVMVAARYGGVRALMRDLFGRHSSRSHDAARALGLVGLEDVADVEAAVLSLGQQKLVGIARALVGRCDVVLLDEPAAGLDSDESAVLANRIRQIADGGIGVLLIDHDMDLVLTTCDRLYVLQFGEMIFAGTPREARNDARVMEAYLGVPVEGDHG